MQLISSSHVRFLKCVAYKFLISVYHCFSDCGKKRRRSGRVVVSKKKRKLLPFSPSEDPERRLEQMASLATALRAVGAKYSNELTYVDGMAPRSANVTALEEGGIQVCFSIQINYKL